MEQVSFINMAEGTREEYEFLESREQAYIAELPDRILAALRKLDDSIGGYTVPSDFVIDEWK